MKLICFTSTYWDHPEGAEEKKPKLIAWHARVKKYLQPEKIFIVGSTRLDQNLNPIPVEIIDTRLPFSKGYDPFNWSYFLCAFEAALWHTMFTCGDFDLLVDWEDDCYVGAKPPDFESLLSEFIARPEWIMAPQWMGHPDFNFLVMKRRAVLRWLHNRRRPNVTDETERLMLAEDELKLIFNGMWYNPWPEIPTMRQEYGIKGEVMQPDSVAMTWPFCCVPSPEMKKVIE